MLDIDVDIGIDIKLDVIRTRRL